MGKTLLVETDFRAGERLIRALDEHNFEVRAAFWVYSEESRVWTLTIASPEYHRLGHLDAFRRFRDIFDTLGIDRDELGSGDTTLIDSNAPIVKEVRRHTHTEPDQILSRPRGIGGFSVNMQYYDDALVYRVS
jgi:hypothetical protein